MKLSEFITQLQQLAIEAGDQDPVVLTTPDSHGIRGTPLSGASLGMHDPGGRDGQTEQPSVYSVELIIRHFSFDPTLDYLWK